MENNKSIIPSRLEKFKEAPCISVTYSTPAPEIMMEILCQGVLFSFKKTVAKIKVKMGDVAEIIPPSTEVV